MPKKKREKEITQVDVDNTPVPVVPGVLNVAPQYYLKAMIPILEYRQEQARSLSGATIYIPSLMKVLEVAQQALDDQAVKHEDREAVQNTIETILKTMKYDQNRWLGSREIHLEKNHEDWSLFLCILPKGELKSERNQGLPTARERRKRRYQGNESPMKP